MKNKLVTILGTYLGFSNATKLGNFEFKNLAEAQLMSEHFNLLYLILNSDFWSDKESKS